MPGQSRPGRCAPVRGDTSSSVEVTNANADTHTAATPSSTTSTPRPLAPVAAVPIANRFASTYFPPSPPSTIASSSVADSDDVRTGDDVYQRNQHNGHGDEEEEEESQDTVPAMDRQLAQAAAAVALTGSNRPSNQVSNPRPNQTQQHLSANMPDTPQQTPNTMSPACASVSHHPTHAEQQFLRGILSDFPLQKGAEHVVGLTEDAGLDLVCKGWRGAVLDQSRIRSADDTNTTNRALYAMLPPQAKAEGLREDVLALLDVASERLRCDLVMIALRRADMDDADWKAILHGLCYVGGTVVATGGTAGQRGKDQLTNCSVVPGVVLVAVEV